MFENYNEKRKKDKLNEFLNKHDKLLTRLSLGLGFIGGIVISYLLDR